jgi:hypothetical protein
LWEKKLAGLPTFKSKNSQIQGKITNQQSYKDKNPQPHFYYCHSLSETDSESEVFL